MRQGEDDSSFQNALNLNVKGTPKMSMPLSSQGH